jgi:hypothetical protein
MISARQRTNSYRPNNQVAQHVLDSTIAVPGLTGAVIIGRAGRSFVVNGLAVAKGAQTILVASKFSGRYYVCHNHQWSTTDAAVIAKCRAAVLKFAA